MLQSQTLNPKSQAWKKFNSQGFQVFSALNLFYILEADILVLLFDVC